MSKKNELPLRLAKEICQKLIERRLLGAEKVPVSLTEIGQCLKTMLEASPEPPLLSLAGELTLKLIEQGRLRTPQQALETIENLNLELKTLSASLPSAQAEPALRSAVNLTVKLLEVHFVSQSQVANTVAKLARASNDLLSWPSDLEKS
ncbi:MAG: hypothetical protein LBT47_05345 [Deltaproteobacteria bacterium]|jgi:hypothetical protein|nr:hypothetical protein [Deltaproteobacteria bacterium]